MVLLGVALVTLLSGDAAGLVAALGGADLDLVILAAVLYAVGQSLSGLMWGACQRAGGVGDMPWTHVLSLHWVSRAACETLPASLGEAVRVAMVRRHPAGAVAGTWRITGGLAAYKALDAVVTGAVVLAILVAAPLPPQVAGLRTTALIALAAGVVILLVARRSGLGGRLRLPVRVRRALRGVRDGAAVLRRPREVRAAALLGIAAIAARLAALAALLAAFSAPPGAALLVFAVIVLSGVVPLTPGGAGAREALLVPALAAAHAVPAATALAVSVSVQATSLVVSLLLGGVALLHRRRVPVAVPAADDDAAVAPARA